MSTPPVSMTCVVPSTGGNFACLDDATSQACVIFEGGPVPTSIRITSLNAVGFNMGTDWRNLACQTVLFEPQFTLGAGETVTRNVNGGGVGFGLNCINAPLGTFHFRVEWGAVAPPAPCAYGTRIIGGGPDQSVYLTADLIASILGRFNAAAAAIFLGSFVGTGLVLGQLCAQLPPPAPTLDLSTSTRSAETLRDLLWSAAWFQFCECVPGTPAAPPPPSPVYVIPPGLPTPPPIVCSNVDLCASIVTILERQQRLETTINQMYAYVTTIQRHWEPFAYIRGSGLGNVTGSGTAQVDRIIGLQAVVTAKPEGLQEFLGAPTYVSDLGWLSLLTGDGLIDEIRLTRDVQTWLSRIAPTATQVGWALREGVSAQLFELLPEP